MFSLNEVRAVPDEVHVIHQPEVREFSRIIWSSHEHGRFLASQVGIDVGVSMKDFCGHRSGLFSASADVLDSHGLFKKSSSILAISQKQHSFYRAAVRPHLSQSALSPVFLLRVESLQGAGRQVYLDFIHDYGTHIVTEGQYGGVASVKASVSLDEV
mmetsp:Transcript_26880/g.67565  ORF Transcript_26880/g.67565 Transcript_26880/m.67565 type:complete len:157 (+) Transcript_26880:641-1111(+)